MRRRRSTHALKIRFLPFFMGTRPTASTTPPAGLAYIEDTGNHDVRTEGMSYGMMLCVQTDHKAEFDALWSWVMHYMYMQDGSNAEVCVRRFWNTPLRDGPRRYYDNCLYFFALLALSGRYRIWPL